MQTVLITGAGGYLGTKLVERFLANGVKVIAVDRFFFGNTLSDLTNNPLLHIVNDDIRSLRPETMQGVDTVIDLAALSHDSASALNPDLTEQINHQGAKGTAGLAKAAGVSRYILSSTCAVYGGSGKHELFETSTPNPLSLYASSKLSAEADVLPLADDNFCATVMRNASIYGLSKRRMRFDLAVNIMTLDAFKYRRILVDGDGSQWRPFIHIDDFVDAALAIVSADPEVVNGQIFNVGSNEQNYQIISLANLIRDTLGDITVSFSGGTRNQLNFNVNFDKLKRTLNFRAKRTIEEGVHEIFTALQRGEVTDQQTTRIGEFYQQLIKKNPNLKLGKPK